MDVSVESPGSIVRRMTVTVPAGEVEQRIETRIAHLAKTAKLSGFRPGKVPIKVVESRFSGQILAEVADELINTSYRDALHEKSITPVGMPSIEAKKMARGEDLEYVATFEVFPQIDRLDIRGRKIEKLVCVVGDADVDQTIQTLRKQHVEWDSRNSPAESGDRLLIDYVGTIGGEVFEGSEAKDYKVILGHGGLLPEFETQLMGQVSGSEVSIAVTFPTNYSTQAVAGKEALFQIQVKEVAKPRLPKVDKAFIQRFGVAEGTEEAFRVEIRGNLGREVESRAQASIRASVFNALLDGNEFELPKALIEDEISRAVENSRRQLEQQGLPSDISIEQERYREEAERRVALGLVMRETVRDRQIIPDEATVRRRIEELAESYDDPRQVIDWYYADHARLSQIEGIVVEELLVERLLEEAVVIEKEIDFQEFMNPIASNAVLAGKEENTEAP